MGNRVSVANMKVKFSKFLGGPQEISAGKGKKEIIAGCNTPPSTFLKYKVLFLHHLPRGFHTFLEELLRECAVI
jgi:hypothetical protein